LAAPRRESTSQTDDNQRASMLSIHYKDALLGRSEGAQRARRPKLGTGAWLMLIASSSLRRSL
jgi:hypothetical protein